MNRAQRVGSAGSLRNAPAGSENVMMQSRIQQLEQQVITVQAEYRQVTERLNCLMLLVKRAWAGDKNAAVHVANIVGAAPPDTVCSYEENGAIQNITSKPKSRPLNNWAMLTIGLLNRSYRHLEKQLLADQSNRLMSRTAYLEEQMRHTPGVKNTVNNEVTFVQNHFPPHSLPSSGLETQSSGHISIPPQRAPSRADVATEDVNQTFLTQPNRSKTRLNNETVAPKKPSSRHLYRPASKTTHPSQVTVTDLFIEPTTNIAADKALTGLYRMSPAASQRGQQMMDDDEDSLDVYDLHYADPRKYEQEGLFTSDGRLFTRHSRPPSGKQQREHDALRSQAKNSGKNGGRALRFETTRPVSAKHTIVGPPSENSQRKQRVKSAGARLGRAASLSEMSSHPEVPPLDINGCEQYESYPENNTASIPLTGVGPVSPLIKVNVKKPASVVKFEGDLDQMAKMEDEFKRTTMSLQKKLGINPDAMVF